MNLMGIEELNDLAQTVKNFAQKEIAPFVDEWDREEKLPLSIFKKMGDLGILGLTTAEKYGGTHLGAEAVAVVMEELSAVCPATCLSYLAHSLLFVHNLEQNGSPEQLEKYLPSLVSGEKIGGMGMTEPEAGSDASGMRTRAVRKGDHYILNGSKMFITNGPVGDVFLVYARTGENRGDLSTFIVEKNFPGFSVGKKLSKMGMRASPTGELIFKDCKVPVENLVGEEGMTLKHMMKNLDIERLGLACMSIGIARACLEHSLKYAQERQQFEQKIVYFQAISEKIANMYIGYKAARAFAYDVAREINSGKRTNQEAAAIKAFASEMATKVALDAIQVLGGYGYIREFPVERLMRDAKLLEIGGGTSEILRHVIVKEFTRKNKNA